MFIIIFKIIYKFILYIFTHNIDYLFIVFFQQYYQYVILNYLINFL